MSFLLNLASRFVTVVRSLFEHRQHRILVLIGDGLYWFSVKWSVGRWLLIHPLPVVGGPVPPTPWDFPH